MNALTKAAIERTVGHSKIQNYAIAIICGVILGVMLGVAV